MTTTEAWWEEIFEGDLALGINKERLAELDEENFLYFKEDESDDDELHS
ncbi:hypothetical protein [Sporosarcina pasteurii]|uniref:Uncharacterized protein n=1 Tax=Sporosarcina pasteurii TaxID=1474 RepID=A0A380BGH2_SPOPA|nr:hypothetical protein [Sporosarcina pasteurii]MDS9470406.1 hypothetical protein [Sporosarcina pasteurii]SUJ00191.1 Uncharacterised protein [Sporosarcina pasteurii]